MKLDDVMRRVRLLREYNTDRGASEAEAHNATRLADLLMDRYRLDREEVKPVPQQFHRPVWDYWKYLFSEFGIPLRTFGKRGSADLGRFGTVIILLQSDEWHIQKASAAGWEIVEQGKGLESMRGYLTKTAPRNYSLFNKK
jgi:Protein of unknown function (DUF2786)